MYAINVAFVAGVFGGIVAGALIGGWAGAATWLASWAVTVYVIYRLDRVMTGG